MTVLVRVEHDGQFYNVGLRLDSAPDVPRGWWLDDCNPPAPTPVDEERIHDLAVEAIEREGIPA